MSAPVEEERRVWDPVAITEAAVAARRVIVVKQDVRARVRAFTPLPDGAKVPRNIPAILRAAEGAGWATQLAALGDTEGTWHGVMCKKDGRTILAVWIDGGFDCAVTGGAGRLFGKLGYRELGKLLKGEIQT